MAGGGEYDPANLPGAYPTDALVKAGLGCGWDWVPDRIEPDRLECQRAGHRLPVLFEQAGYRSASEVEHEKNIEEIERACGTLDQAISGLRGASVLPGFYPWPFLSETNGIQMRVYAAMLCGMREVLKTKLQDRDADLAGLENCWEAGRQDEQLEYKACEVKRYHRFLDHAMSAIRAERWPQAQ